MLVSVFTPSNNPTWLPEVYDCLKQQTYQNWEWVVVPNGPNASSVIQIIESFNDSRIKLFPLASGSIGTLKKFACDNSKGDLFLEYDHDDLITEDCLEEVVKEANKSSDDAFIFSDALTLNPDGTSQVYGTKYGWHHYKWSYYDKEYIVNKQFDINPKSLSEILWCPDHVRVWTRKAYQKTGGHNPELAVCDDHDLIIRTYLAGTSFRYVNKTLYIHRLRKDNTCTVRVNEIQEKSRFHCSEFLVPLVEEWCQRENIVKYDLGGAHNCPAGYIPIDRHQGKIKGLELDILTQDFDDAVPDNSVGCFRAHDFFEHIPIGKVTGLLNVLYKKLVPGGWILSQTPSVSDSEGRVGRGAYQDPTHVSFWSENNWWYYTDKNYSRFVPEIKCRFQATILKTFYPSDWHKNNFIPYVRCYMSALKEENEWWPGPKLI
jgi:glycosyltransferase involved in cell wall biosynthesis